MSHFLITGGSGFLGRALATRLREQHLVRALGGQDEGDLTHPLALREAFTGAPYDCIIHCADVSAPGPQMAKAPADYLLPNAAITANVLWGWRTYQPQARFVALGSPLAYPVAGAGGPAGSVAESWYGCTPMADPVYGLHKALLTAGIEAVKKQDGLKGTTLVLGAVYGPGDTSDRVIPSVRKRMLAGDPVIPLWTTGEELRPFIHIDTQVDRILRALEYDGAVLNVGPPTSQTVRWMIDALADTMRYNGEIVPGLNVGDSCTLDTRHFDDLYGGAA